MNLDEIDKNFKLNTQTERNDIVFRDCLDTSFKLFGLIPPKKQGENFWRLPKGIAKEISAGVHLLGKHTTGGRLCFITDSDVIAIHSEYSSHFKMGHCAMAGTIGYDLFAKDEEKDSFKWAASYVPDPNIDGVMDIIKEFPQKKMRRYILNFPTYSEVLRLCIGLSKNAKVIPYNPYKNIAPVCFYGSSITQGACSSRPGTTYMSILSNRLGFDYVNLGFSGGGRGEKKMAEYLASIPMSVFVYDYDHNSPSADHYESTHEPNLRLILKEKPNLPVICLTRPDYFGADDERRRREIALKTVENLKKEGHKHIYFIDGKDFFNGTDAFEYGLVDGCHPNDLGHYFMANAIEPYLKKCLDSLK